MAVVRTALDKPAVVIVRPKGRISASELSEMHSWRPAETHDTLVDLSWMDESASSAEQVVLLARGGMFSSRLAFVAPSPLLYRWASFFRLVTPFQTGQFTAIEVFWTVDEALAWLGRPVCAC